MKGSFLPEVVVRVPFFPFRDNFTQQELNELFQQPVANEALFLASPDLHSEYHRWLNKKLEADKEAKLFESLRKYALRMHTRCTPFGLFSGCGTASLANIGSITFRTDVIERATRFDMNFTCALAQQLAQWELVKPYLKWHQNSSLYPSHDKIRYVEYHYQGRGRVHQVSAVEKSPYIDKVIQLAQRGATIGELSTGVMDEDVTLEEAESFILNLIDAQILVSELDPAVIGSELLQQILTTLSRIVVNNPVDGLIKLVALLKELQSELTQIDARSGNDSEVYYQLVEKVKTLNVPFELGKLFQTDLFLTFSKNVTEPQNETETILMRALRVLNKLSPMRNDNLKAFKERFKQRYEEQELPLSQVLDIETGIGYGSAIQHADVAPFVDDLVFGGGNSSGTEIKWNRLQSFLFQKILIAREERKLSVFISEDELSQFEENWFEIPDSISVSFSLANIDGKRVVNLNSAGGSSAINLVGRFGGNSKDLRQLIDQIVSHENGISGDAIRASIAHLPESRTGNVTLRPVIRQYEIPYLSNSHSPFDSQIELNDLFVSIRHDRVVLRSRKLNAEIIPCLDNAHNYANQALPIYHFLCDLQNQGKKPGMYFDWGQLKNEFSFLPRVEIEGAILFPAMWRVRMDKLFTRKDNDESIKLWREKHAVPERVLLLEGDNELLINFNDPISVKIFEKILIKKQYFFVKELIFDRDHAVVRDQNNQAYVSEFIGIYLNSANKDVKREKRRINEQSLEARKFVPGSEWLYYKIYCGTRTADRILVDLVKPFTEALTDEGRIDRWFFIRYMDPEPHIRLRFHGMAESLNGIVGELELTLRPFIENGLIWKTQLDTYEREVERYGAGNMVNSESIFHEDSKSCLSVLANLNGDEGEQYRWRFAVKMIDDLLNAFGLDLESKKSLTKEWSENFAREFSADNAPSKKQLSNKFRLKRLDIDLAMKKEWFDKEEIGEIWEVLEARKNDIARIASDILVLFDRNEIAVQKSNLIGSYVHMFCNRFFRSKQRLFEFVLFDLLHQFYKSQAAIKAKDRSALSVSVSPHENFN